MSKSIESYRVALAGMLLAMLTSGCAASAYLGYAIAPDFPVDKTETIRTPELGGQVQIYLDTWGIAHIEASDEEDLMRAVGFVHGRARFFQMDSLRRFAQGRLSELLGKQKVQFGTTFELDATMRGWGFGRLAQDDAGSLDERTRGLMEAYCAGVNLALERHRPVEYRLLGVEPEPWRPADSFAVGRLVGWSISHNWHQELSRLVVVLFAGADRGEAIYPHEPWPGGTSVDLPGAQRPLPPGIAPEIRSMFPPRENTAGGAPGRLAARSVESDLTAFGGASNAWVIGADRSASKKPLLANDPHMSHMLPSLMFQQHLKAKDLDVIGVTAPGLPYVLIGHNRHVAWGMTSAVGDVMDLYIERPFEGANDKVEGPHGPERIKTTEEIIRVREGSDFVEHRVPIRHTKRGPLINDLYPQLLPAWAPLVSLRWDARGAGRSIAGLGRANRARTVAELRLSLLEMPTPINSVMAADVQGKIALFPTGRLPKRLGHRGTFPAPAWLPEYDWDGSVAAADMPVFEGGAGDAFAHGNNLMYDPARASIWLQVDSAPSYRLDRIGELLAAEPSHDVDSFRRLQHDVFLNRAKRLIRPILADLAGLQGYLPRELPALRLLAAWDQQATVDSPAAAIFFLTYRLAIVGAISDEVNAKGKDYLLSQRYFTNAADLWFDDPNHPVWDDLATQRVESRADMVRRAFRQAIVQLRETQGSDPEGWRWGTMHFQQARHPFGGKLDSFNLARREAGGGPDSVWKSHLDLGHPVHPFRAVAGPVLRMIVDLADLDHGLWIIDTGNSGWPGSPHYADQYALWQERDYAVMLMDWDEIRRSAKAVITLAPAPSGAD